MHLVAVKELMGHEDIKTTLIYAGIAPENKKYAIEIMNKAIQ
jgi:site-specific recombinase XerD